MSRISLRKEIIMAIEAGTCATIDDTVMGADSTADAIIAILRRRASTRAAARRANDIKEGNAPPRQGSKCPNWPRCGCGTQGYINRREPSWCGAKPKTRRKS